MPGSLFRAAWALGYSVTCRRSLSTSLNPTLETICVLGDENQEPHEKGEYPDEPGYKGVFINAHIVELGGNEWSYNEGCLSIPKIREDINRRETVTLRYQDENFVEHIKSFNGITARVILHEYDHIEGKLFIDYIKPLKRTLMKRKLDDISKGKVNVDYRMLFPK